MTQNDKLIKISDLIHSTDGLVQWEMQCRPNGSNSHWESVTVDEKVAGKDRQFLYGTAMECLKRFLQWNTINANQLQDKYDFRFVPVVTHMAISIEDMKSRIDPQTLEIWEIQSWREYFGLPRE